MFHFCFYSVCNVSNPTIIYRFLIKNILGLQHLSNWQTDMNVAWFNKSIASKPLLYCTDQVAATWLKYLLPQQSDVKGLYLDSTSIYLSLDVTSVYSADHRWFFSRYSSFLYTRMGVGGCVVYMHVPIWKCIQCIT